ncbi:unnamed protein product [Protopolystoma xenopodis]|uniref:Uncharacterized protein n=1 Tax=Protopolystoma xenopodis TaxID=117903 RepID=A0A3S5AHP2_9PLAT|nr:unnamed protein product [Protopolystoma xenopodis]
MVMGQTAQGDPLRDSMRLLVDVLKFDFPTVEQRLRLILIFLLTKSDFVFIYKFRPNLPFGLHFIVSSPDGMSEAHFDRLLECARVSPTNKPLVISLSGLLGARLIEPDVSLPAQHPILFALWYILFRNRQYPIYPPNHPEDPPSGLSILSQLPTFSNARKDIQDYLPFKGKRPDRVDDNCYALSRWSPYLYDLIEVCTSFLY